MANLVPEQAQASTVVRDVVCELRMLHKLYIGGKVTSRDTK